MSKRECLPPTLEETTAVQTVHGWRRRCCMPDYIPSQARLHMVYLCWQTHFSGHFIWIDSQWRPYIDIYLSQRHWESFLSELRVITPIKVQIIHWYLIASSYACARYAVMKMISTTKPKPWRHFMQHAATRPLLNKKSMMPSRKQTEGTFISHHHRQ